MGLLPDQDIVTEMLSLMGPEALELTISKESIESNKKINIYSDGGADADVSSVNSKSQRSESGADK